MKAIMAGALMVLMVSTARAQSDDRLTGSVLPGCRTWVSIIERGGLGNAPSQTAYEAGLCAGFIYALPHSFQINGACVPDGTQYDQLARVIIRFVETNPGRDEVSFLVTAGIALRDAWPCEQRWWQRRSR